MAAVSAFLIVDTEGQAAADDLEVINPVVSATDNLHDGMLLYLQAADASRVVTVKNSSSANGILTADGEDVVLNTASWYCLQLRQGTWREVKGLRLAQAEAEAAAVATTPATETSYGMGRLATLQEVEDGATDTTTNPGPAFVTPETAAAIAGKRNVGELVHSLVPLDDAGLHLLDGSLLPADGIYAAGIAKIAALQTDCPGLFVTEADWQASAATYGVCGKFVYDATAGTLRLPRVTGFMEATIDATALGDLVEAGLPNVLGKTAARTLATATGAEGAFYRGSANGNNFSPSGTERFYELFIDASRSSSIYGNSDTVQPQSIKGFVYIVLANVVKTPVEADVEAYIQEVRDILSDGSLVYNTRTVVTTSGSWSAPMTGWYKITCIGGGGGSPATLAKGFGGSAGGPGATAGSDATALSAHAAGGNGGAGAIIIEYFDPAKAA